MATRDELAERLLRRFKGVPNFTVEDARELIDDAMQAHGLSPSDGVPADKQTMILLYAQHEGAWSVAMSVAHYFKYTDGEESVDKSMVSENYRKLARDLRDDYEREKSRIDGSAFVVMRRIDRP